jgi:D-glycero-D-manno-heptose 1,7-bisphosphate phosphatase
MSRAAVFFDRDNTLIVANGYLADPSQVRLVTGAADAVARVRRLGYATIVFSNQSGVARGLFSEDDVRAVNARMDALLTAEDPAAVIDRHEFCPFHPDAKVAHYRVDSELRKPRPGMLHKAAQTLDVDLRQSWVIGDAARDVEAGHAAGCRTILFRDPALAPSPAAEQAPAVAPDFTVSTLAQAVDLIERCAQPASDNPQEPAMSVLTGSSHGTAEPDLPRASTPPAPIASPWDAPAAPRGSASADPAAAWAPDRATLESLVEQILREVRQHRRPEHTDFSVSKLLAGIVQILTLAVLFGAYLRSDSADRIALLLLAQVLQTMTIALLIMGRQH